MEVALPLLRPGGLFITDNALWEGRVARSGRNPDADTAGVMRFNRMVFDRPDLRSVILPIRDGLAVCLKTAGP